jgi:hypothetical protein
MMAAIEWMTPETDGYGRMTIGRWGGYFIDICPMLFNDRLVLTPEHDTDVYDYGWCYPKGNAAVLAAFDWDPETQAEPAGYIKRATPTVRTPGETAMVPHQWNGAEQLWTCLTCGEKHVDPCVCRCHGGRR